MTFNNRNVTGFIAAKNNQSPPKMTDMNYANNGKKARKKNPKQNETGSMGESLRVEAAAAVERESERENHSKGSEP